MTDTLTPSQRTQLSADIRRIQAAGGPKWYDWCDLEDSAIEVAVGDDYGDDSWCYCPPAVAAAVVMFCGEVRAWTKRDTDIGVWRGEWYWSFGVGDTDYDDPDYKAGDVDSQLTASLALISAVAGGLEEE